MKTVYSLVVATAISSLCAVVSASAVAQSSPQILDISFTVQGAPNSAAGDTASGGAALTDPQAGSLLDAASVLGLMQEQSAAGAPMPSHFGASTVFAAITDGQTGATSLYPITECDSASFETAQDVTFDQQVSCGGKLLSMSLAPDGIAIVENGEVYGTIPLQPNAYIINGVPYIIR